jgi:hypothetical protein
VAPLGSFPDLAALIPVVRSRISEQLARPSAAASGSSTNGSSTASGCQAAAATAAGIETSTLPVFRGTLAYAGTPAQVYAFQRPASTAVAVVSAGSCLILAEGSF